MGLDYYWSNQQSLETKTNGLQSQQLRDRCVQKRRVGEDTLEGCKVASLLLLADNLQVRVGEIVQVIDGQLFPADLVLLASSEPYGTAYIETSSLDGEANLKMKQAHPSTIHLTTDDLLMSYFARIDCEPPNRHLNEFCGKLMLPNGDVHSLNLTQILLRGAKLKNTKWILGTVIYSGHDSKLLMNSKTVPLKK